MGTLFFAFLIIIAVNVLRNYLLEQGKTTHKKQHKNLDQELGIDEELAAELKKFEQELKIDYSNAYQSKYLLTKNEWYEYKKLKEFAAQKGLQICPKVRLADIVEPRNGKHHQANFNKIKAKHVDFVITDPNLYIKAIIELDDNSHDSAERKDRDKFVDQVLTSVGYRVIHTRTITEETLKDI